MHHFVSAMFTCKTITRARHYVEAILHSKHGTDRDREGWWKRYQWKCRGNKRSSLKNGGKREAGVPLWYPLFSCLRWKFIRSLKGIATRWFSSSFSFCPPAFVIRSSSALVHCKFWLRVVVWTDTGVKCRVHKRKVAKQQNLINPNSVIVSMQYVRGLLVYELD